VTPPPSNKGLKFPAEPLTRDEVLRLLAAASNRSNSGVRMRAHVAVLFGAGLRLQESLDLEPRDVDTEDQTVRVREGKGRKARTVGIDSYACALIDRWLDRRRKLGLGPRHRVFATYSTGNFGQPLQQRYVRLALKRLGERADLTKRIHPHGLRHSLASDMADTGSSVSEIQRQLGHSSLATTDRYVHALRPMELIEHMRGRDWAGVFK
jgi:integrase/recombinase XerD